MKRLQESGGPQESPATTGRVLVIADAAEQRERYGYLMGALRFEALEAAGMRDAISLTDTIQPNMIFIDLQDEEEAIATSRRMQRYFGGAVPILLTVKLGGIPAERRVADAGASDYVAHPIDEVELIFKLRTMMSHATRVQDLQRINTRLDSLLRRHVGGPLVDRWLAAPEEEGYEVTGREVVVTVLFADLNGFTRMSSQWPAERTVLLLNEILTVCTLPLVDYGGTVDKYIGDCVMAFFGPEGVQPDHATRAVRAARATQLALRRWMAHHTTELEGDIHVSIGLNTGAVVLGNMGSSLRLDHTVIGDAVNVAARLQDIAPVGAVYAGARTVREAGDTSQWQCIGDRELRGRIGAVEVFELIPDPDAD